MANALDVTDAERRIAERVTPESARSVGVGRSSGVVIRDMSEAMEFAKLMSIGGIAIRKHLRAQPGVCLAVTVQAVEWGMSPFTVANKSYMVNDQLAYESQLITALMLSRIPLAGRPEIEYTGDSGTTRVCTVTVTLKDGQVIKHSSPQVGKITPKNSPLWKSDEDQQLGYYTQRAMVRLRFPDVLLSVGAMAVDEAMDQADIAPQARDITPARQTTTDKLDQLAGISPTMAQQDEAQREGADPVTGEIIEPEKPKATRGRKPAAAKQEPAPQPTQQERVAEAASHPTVQAAINAFPGAQVSDVRLNDDAGDETEVEQPADTPAPSADDDPFDEFDEPAPTETVDPEEERILTRLGDMDGVPSWIDDVKLGRQFLAGHDVATQGRPLSTIPAEMRADPARSLECQAWAAGHDFVTGDSSEKRRERKAAREKAQQQR